MTLVRPSRLGSAEHLRMKRFEICEPLISFILRRSAEPSLEGRTTVMPAALTSVPLEHRLALLGEGPVGAREILGGHA
jgi:hypothetical protein